MAAEIVDVVLNAAEFPFLSSQLTRTVVTSRDMSPRLPQSFVGAGENANFQVPQLMYCENMLPTAKGMMAVGFATQVAAITPATVLCDQAIQLRDVAENQFLCVPAGGANYVMTPSTTAWASVNPVAGFTGALVTRAYVNGRTFICYEKTKIIEYNSATNTFTDLVLTLPAGITMSTIRGIGGASNYLLLFTDISIYWCSPLNLLDFATTDQGAGQQTPIDIKGQITCILTCPGGFIAYTSRNAVAGVFTNNGNSPFVFKEVQNCGGVPNWERVSGEADDAAHYIWGTNGLQRVSLAKAESVHPSVTDFLASGIYEYWDAVNKRIKQGALGSPFSVKLSFLIGRYLIISYGQARNSFDAALFYDTVLERWGKVVSPHADVFMYTYPTAAGAYNYDQLPGFFTDLGEDSYSDLDVVRLVVPGAKRGIAFLKASGQIDILSVDYAQTTANSVLVFGRLQSVRQRLITVNRAEFDGLKESPTPTVTLLASYDGLNVDAAAPMTLVNYSGNYRWYDSRQTAKNFQIAIEGNFVLTSMLLRVTNNGYR